MTTSSYDGPITNVIVVMLENRSYDNILGALYMASTPPPKQSNLNGLTGSEWNPNPTSKKPLTIGVNNQTTPTQLSGSNTSYPPTTIPLRDPGEFFGDMAWQITGSEQKNNPYKSWSPAASPQPPLPPPTDKLPDPLPQMAGFTGNFNNQQENLNLQDVMNYFTPSQLPVTSWLASNFAVCDQWFASVPGQTFVNRAFALCAAPGVDNDLKYSLIDDEQYVAVQTLGNGLATLPSILSQLDTVYHDNARTAPLNWKVYFHDYSIAIQTVMDVYNAAQSASNVNVATYDHKDWGKTVVPKQLNPHLSPLPTTFVEDLDNNNLPKFSFIEPRYSNNYTGRRLLPPNSNHPGAANYIDLAKAITKDPVSNTNPPIDVTNGELFLMHLYNRLRASSYWDTTLLIITYDEHGGLYDHVPPLTATSPGSTTSGITIPAADDTGDIPSDYAAQGFDFNVLGGRVPAIIVSKYIEAGSSIPQDQNTSVVFDHTSIIKTVWDIFNLSNKPSTITSLTQRDADANSLVDYVQPPAANTTGQYAGDIIIAGPSSLVFAHDDLLGSTNSPQILFASAGSIPLQATAVLTQENVPNWLTISTSGTTTLEITVSLDRSGTHHDDSPYTGEIQITGSGAANSPLVVPVTFYIKY